MSLLALLTLTYIHIQNHKGVNTVVDKEYVNLSNLKPVFTKVKNKIINYLKLNQP